METSHNMTMAPDKIAIGMAKASYKAFMGNILIHVTHLFFF